MEWKIKKGFPLAALSLLGMTSSLSAAQNNSKDKCAPIPGAPCYTVDEPCSYCLGPQEVNPAVRPKTCDGDIVFTVAGFYWNAYQDGMAYAIDNQVENPNAGNASNSEQSTLIDATYKNPDFSWDFGFKIGLGYNTTHDGWDVGAVWTHFHTTAHTHIEQENNDQNALLPIWSAFAPSAGGGPILWATDIETHWRVTFDYVDVDLGREFWTSKYLSMRPHIGLRLLWIKQEYEIEHNGGSWQPSSNPPSLGFNNRVDIDQKYHGVGLRGGIDTVWTLGRGFGVYGDFSVGIVYGRFHVEHDETNRESRTPHHKSKILETEDNFRASRGTTDVVIGLQWTTLFSNCRYGFTGRIGWEHHMFFDQNQMWRVMRIGDQTSVQPNTSGENVYKESRGDLSTQGWTLTFIFEF